MSSKRKQYSPEFKAKVVLELIEGDDQISVVASKYDLNPTLLSAWRKQLFDNASDIFCKERQISEQRKIEKSHDKEVDNLNRIIGELTVERDYLQKSCQEIIRRRKF